MSPVAESTDLTLFEYEHWYQDLFDPETLASVDWEPGFLERLKEALERKREGVAQFFLHVEYQRKVIKEQRQRLQRRDDLFANAEARMYRYVADVIKSLGQDSKGKYKKIQAPSATMFLRALPDSVDILDDNLVPPEYKTVTVEMPFDLWLRLREKYPELQAEHALGIKAKDPVVDVTAVKNALKDGAEIPGADLRMSGWDHSLVVK